MIVNAEELKLGKLTIQVMGIFIEIKLESFQHDQSRDQFLVDKIQISRISKLRIHQDGQ